MEYHPLVEKITSLLKDNGFWFETFEHEPVRTSEEAAKIRTGYSLEQGTKALIIKVYGRRPSFAKATEGLTNFVMLIVRGSDKFDEKKVKDLLGIKEFRFATEQEVKELTGGVLPGGVPPFGNLFGLKVFVDKKVLNNEKIVFNAGDKRFSIGMYSKDWLKLVGPVLAEIAIFSS